MENSVLVLKEKGASSEIKRNGFELTLNGIEKWLLSKNIIDRHEKLSAYHDLNEWHKAGGETYSAIFAVKTDRSMAEYIIKAITTMNPEEGLKNWVRRRKILEENNVSVSKWYWFGEGIIVEQFYPYDFKKFKDFNALVKMSHSIDKLGFASLKFLDDVRCDENGNPFYVDFGFDLGEPKSLASNQCINALKGEFPERSEEIETILKSLAK